MISSFLVSSTGSRLANHFGVFIIIREKSKQNQHLAFAETNDFLIQGYLKKLMGATYNGNIIMLLAV